MRERLEAAERHLVIPDVVGMPRTSRRPGSGFAMSGVSDAQRSLCSAPRNDPAAVGEVVSDGEGYVGRVELVVAPAPRGAEQRTARGRGFADEGAAPRAGPPAPNVRTIGAGQAAPRAHHVARDHLSAAAAGSSSSRKNARARVPARARDHDRAPSAGRRAGPRSRRRSVQGRTQRRESLTVTFGEHRARRAVSVTLLPPLADPGSRGMVDLDGGVVAHEPALVVEPPHEVHVFTDPQ